jgi:predicted nucleotidyltransferase
MSKFTVNSGKIFDRLVKRDLKKAVDYCLALPQASLVKSIILMGSYGRGEGTSLQTAAGLRPFNDYDLVVVGKSMSELKRKSFQKVLHVLEQEVSRELGITVDYFLHTENSLKRAECTLMNYEMKYGHMVLYGDKDILKLVPEMTEVPLREATRLLLNRGKLLLDIQETINTWGSVPKKLELLYRKYLNKMVLALGDSALLACDLYDISYVNKREQINYIDGLNEPSWLQAEYRKAIDFKFSGNCQLLPQNIENYFETVKGYFVNLYYWLEGIRLKQQIVGYDDYLKAVRDNHQLHERPFRNVMLNFKAFGLKTLCSPRWLLKHPRERLFAVFPILLKKSISVQESHLINRLEGCAGKLDDGILKFYNLRNCYL